MAIKDIYQAVLDFNEAGIQDQIKAEIDAGTEVGALLNDGLIAAMDTIGENFSTGKMFFPEMLLAAQTMSKGMEVLKPVLTERKIAMQGTIVIGTVKGDLHDIGKNLVSMMLEGGGYTVINLGFDIPVEQFIQAAEDEDVKMIALSALLTTTMPNMRKVVEILTSKGMRERVKVIIGGAPVTQAYADEIGADGYGADGPAAVELTRRLIG